jgi:hypothetical protein
LKNWWEGIRPEESGLQKAVGLDVYLLNFEFGAQRVEFFTNIVHHQLHLGQVAVAFVAYEIQTADRIRSQIDIDFL